APRRRAGSLVVPCAARWASSSRQPLSCVSAPTIRDRTPTSLRRRRRSERAAQEQQSARDRERCKAGDDDAFPSVAFPREPGKVGAERSDRVVEREVDGARGTAIDGGGADHAE